MARAQIPLKDFTDSKVPPVCILSGLPAENVFKFRFDGVEGALPVHGAAIKSLARLRMVILGLAAASVGAFAVGTFTGSAIAALLALGFIIIAVATTIAARRRLVVGKVHEDVLRLDRVHPEFVQAVDNGEFGTCSKCPSLDQCPNRDPADCV